MNFLPPDITAVFTSGVVLDVSSLVIGDEEPNLALIREISGIRLGHEDTCPDDDADDEMFAIEREAARQDYYDQVERGLRW